MLEILHSSGQDDGKVFSKLGPGPTELIGGDESAGFFGECITLDLISGNALAAAIGLSNGVAQNSDEPWLKFIIDGRIVYIAKKPLRYSLNWSSINAVGAAFGSAIVQVGPYRFSVSLPKGRNPNTGIAFTTGIDTACTWNSEWNRLLYPVTVTDGRNPKKSQVGPNWISYSETDLVLVSTAGNGYQTLCQENSSVTTKRVYRGYSGICAVNETPSILTSAAAYGWRPRLELLT